jgi:cysteine desulfurase
MGDHIYLDYNATAPARAQVVEAMTAALGAPGNASSVHAPGRAARARIEAARSQVAALVGAQVDQVIFTGSGTEANNQALRCAGRSRAVVSAIEHESVLRTRPDAALAPVDERGQVDLAALDGLLAAGDGAATIVSVMLANNETGVVQPVAEIAALARRHGALVHCDAVQAVGKIAVDFAALGVDFLTLSAHKLAGPQGIGALIAAEPQAIAPLLHGGGQEQGRRAGTESVANIAGFGVAASCAGENLAAFGRLAQLRDGLEAEIAAVAPGTVVFGGAAPRLPNTSKATMPGVRSDTQVMAMDLAGIAISAGSACAAGTVAPPYVLSAMGVADALAVTAVRVSLGWGTEAWHIERFVAAWTDLYRRAGAHAA